MDELLDEAATNTFAKPSKIVDKHINPMNPYLKGKLVKIKSISQRARRKKIKIQGKVPDHPSSLASIEHELPESYRVIKVQMGDKKWLFHDSGPSTCSNRYFIFTTDENLELVKNSPSLYGDGTFKVNLFNYF